MNYTALNVGPYDASIGISILQTRSSLPYLSANIFDKSGKPVFQQFLVKEIGNDKIGIIGATKNLSQLEDEFHVKTWPDVLPNLVNELKKECSFIILLSALSSTDNKKIAEQFPSIRVILSASIPQHNVQPKHVNNAIITQTGKRGQYLGFLSIFNSEKPHWENDRQPAIDYQKKKIDALSWQINRLQKNTTPSKQDSKKLARLTAKRQVAEREFDKIQKEHTSSQNTGIQASFKVRFFALTSKVQEDLRIKNQIETLKKKINEFNTGKIKKQKTVQKKTTQELVGQAKCSECHATQTEFWESTAHSQAYKTLERKNESNNLNCLYCHVTQEPSRFLTTNAQTTSLLSLKKPLRSVGCESCHGSGVTHSSTPDKNMDRSVKEAVCLNCHTSERDSNFNYSVKRKLIACPAEG